MTDAMRLHVLLHGVRAGGLTLQHGDLSTFLFDANYLALAERPVLGRWFEDRLNANVDYKRSRCELPPFFQNYLPETHSALRELLARRAGVERHQEMQLLRELGPDLPGAIVVTTDAGALADDPSPAVPVASAVPHEQPLRFSLAGMQLKFSVLRDDHGFTLPVTGMGGRWILKPPYRGVERVPENEFSVLTWARMTGIDVPPFELATIKGVEGLPPEYEFDEPWALVVGRYDRGEDGARIHQEDFAQVLNLPSEDKYRGANYATLGNIIYRVCGPEDWEEFVRRLTFVVLSGNHDAHLKNWSLIYPDTRRARLSPAYDLVATVCYSGYEEALALSLSGTKDMAQVSTLHFHRMAQKIGADPDRALAVVGETAQRAREAFRTLRSDMRLSPEALGRLERHLADMKL
jgi:serine/threonine-protein kinase HipA